jgi:nucleoid DNA-binding protein
MAKLMSKSELIQKIAEQHANNMTRKDVKDVIETLAEIGHKELKKTGAFFVPGFAKLIVIKKPATKARKGHQSVHERADDVQGEASSEGHQGSPGKGCQRRYLVAV